MTTHVLVYVDSLNRNSMTIEPGAYPIGYIERRPDEPIETTARIARECFGVRSDEKLRLRAIAPKALDKLQLVEGQAKNLTERDFARIFEKSGAKPGRWIRIPEHATSVADEENSKRKPLQKRLFR